MARENTGAPEPKPRRRRSRPATPKRPRLRPERIQSRLSPEETEPGKEEEMDGTGSTERRAGSGANASDRLWGRMLGLTEGDLAGLQAVWRESLTSAEAAAVVPGWRLAEDEDELWFSAVFRFPAFEAAALYTNFLFATLQATTAPVAVQVMTGSNGEVEVKIRDSAAAGLTWGTALFAYLASQGARLVNGRLTEDGASDGRE